MVVMTGGGGHDDITAVCVGNDIPVVLNGDGMVVTVLLTVTLNDNVANHVNGDKPYRQCQQ